MEKTTTRAVKPKEVEQQPAPFYVRLHQAKQLIGKVHKNATNPQFKKSYADINSILETVEPILLQHDLLLLQPIDGGSVCTQIVCIYTGFSISSCMALDLNLDAQKQGSQISYFRRYTIQSLLTLQATDDDGHIATTAKPTINNNRFKDAVKAIADGNYTVEKLKDSFDLTDVQINSLLLIPMI
jgi:hypothetical protein